MPCSLVASCVVPAVQCCWWHRHCAGTGGAPEVGARYAASPRRTGRSVGQPLGAEVPRPPTRCRAGRRAARRGACAGTRSRSRSRRRTRTACRRGEPQVGDLVELAQRAEDGHADLVGRRTRPAPEPRSASSTCWPRQARSSSVTGRPLQALRTPAIALSRLNASVAPDRFTTVSCISSTVVNRFSHAEQERRRRIELPSSATRESRTRVSVWRQYGQCTAAPLACRIRCSGRAALSL